jgi:hypothetical protein
MHSLPCTRSRRRIVPGLCIPNEPNSSDHLAPQSPINTATKATLLRLKQSPLSFEEYSSGGYCGGPSIGDVSSTWLQMQAPPAATPTRIVAYDFEQHIHVRGECEEVLQLVVSMGQSLPSTAARESGKDDQASSAEYRDIVPSPHQ